MLVALSIDTTIIENSMEVFKKLRVELPYDPAISLLDVCPEKAPAGKERTPTSMAAPFPCTHAQQPANCPPGNEWKRKLC